MAHINADQLKSRLASARHVYDVAADPAVRKSAHVAMLDIAQALGSSRACVGEVMSASKRLRNR